MFNSLSLSNVVAYADPDYIFISGPSGSGKTRYCDKLADYYCCQHIVDGWPLNSPTTTPGRTLILTQSTVRGAIPIEVALREAGITKAESGN